MLQVLAMLPVHSDLLTVQPGGRNMHYLVIIYYFPHPI